MAELLLTVWTTLSLLPAPIAEGKATRYNPRVMQEVVHNRVRWGQLDLTVPHKGFVAVADCGYIGETAWIRLPDGAVKGPYLVADCGAARDQASLRRIGFAVDLSWELALEFGVIDMPLYGVTVYIGGRPMPVYEYECEECGNVFALVRQLAQREARARCPNCRGDAKFRMSVPGRFRRGSGWRARMDGASMPGRI